MTEQEIQAVDALRRELGEQAREMLRLCATAAALVETRESAAWSCTTPEVFQQYLATAREFFAARRARGDGHVRYPGDPIEAARMTLADCHVRATLGRLMVAKTDDLVAAVLAAADDDARAAACWQWTATLLTALRDAPPTAPAGSEF